MGHPAQGLGEGVDGAGIIMQTIQVSIPKTGHFHEYHARTRFFRHSNGKSEARSELARICRTFLAGRKGVRVLSLPGCWWHFEKALLGENGRKWTPTFIGCEFDRRVFPLATLRMPHKPNGARPIRCKKMAELGDCDVISNSRDAILVNADIHQFIKVTNKKFRLIWFDLMSMTTRKLLKSMKESLRVLEPECVLALNVLIGRESIDLIADMRKFPDRAAFLADFVQRELGPEFRLVQNTIYSDSEHAQARRLQMAWVRGDGPTESDS